MKYKLSIISLLDILGFKNIVKSNDPNKISRILKHFKYFSRTDRDISKAYQQSFVNFSDLSVRATNILSKLNKEIQIGLVSFELIDLLHIQLNLINQGIFIRGAITIDEIYLSSSLAFGPGLVTVYELESVMAKYPRIILDKDLLKSFKSVPLLKSSEHSAKDEVEFIKKFIKKDADGIWFIDYLKGAESELDDIYQYLDFLKKHKKLIIQNYKKAEKNKSTKRKFIWLKIYHNKYIKNIGSQYFKNHGLKISDYIIYKKDLEKTNSSRP